METSQTHRAPFLYIGNSTGESKQHEQPQSVEPQQTSFISRVEPDHVSSSGRHSARNNEQSHIKRQEAPNPQRTAQEKRGYNSPSNPLTETHGSFAEQTGSQNVGQSHQSMEPFASSRSRQSAPLSRYKQSSVPLYQSAPPSQYKQSSVPLYQSGSQITSSFDRYKPTSEPPSKKSHLQQQRTPSLPTSHGRNKQVDFTFSNWKAVNPSEADISSDRVRSRPSPLFEQSEVPPTIFENAQARPTQQENASQAQAQKPDRASWSHSTPAPQPGPPSGHFSVKVPLHRAPIPGSPKENVPVFIDPRSLTWEPEGGKAHRQTRVSAAQIQQQVQLPFPSPAYISDIYEQYATVCEHWHHFSTGVEDLIGMLQSE